MIPDPATLRTVYRATALILAAGYAVILVWAIYKIDRDNPPR